jgi:hypothetical protein
MLAKELDMGYKSCSQIEISLAKLMKLKHMSKMAGHYPVIFMFM